MSNILEQLELIRSLFIVKRVNQIVLHRKTTEYLASTEKLRTAKNETFPCDVEKPKYKKVCYKHTFFTITRVINSKKSFILKFLAIVFIVNTFQLFLIIDVIRVISAKISNGREKEAAREYNKKLDEDYAREMERYREEKEEFDKDKTIRVARYEKEVEDDKKEKDKYEEYASISSKAYEKVLEHVDIHDKYKDIVPICQFIKYLESGRCKALTGTHGCYNEYEEELRKNLIHDNLENIDESLPFIKLNQQVLAKTFELIESISEILHETAQCIEDNANAINECKYLIENIDGKSNEILARSSLTNSSISALFNK